MAIMMQHAAQRIISLQLFLLVVFLWSFFPEERVIVSDAPYVRSQQMAALPNITYFMPRTTTSEPVVFLLGFHKVGTRSTYNLFRGSGINSVHNNRFNDRPNGTLLGRVMSRNYRANRSILEGVSPPYRFFSDFGTVPTVYDKSVPVVPWYRLAVDQYPGSKFILQIRSVNKWLHSRFTHWHHTGGFIPDRMRQKNKSVLWNGTMYHLADYNQETANILILKSWKEEWYQYMCGVLYFFRSERPELSTDLLIFDIEQDDAQKIADFTAGFGMNLNATKFDHTGGTKLFKMENPTALRKQLDKWDATTRNETTIVVRDHFGSETERILSYCSTGYYHSVQK